jgi:hypothetical protein
VINPYWGDSTSDSVYHHKSQLVRAAPAAERNRQCRQNVVSSSSSEAQSTPLADNNWVGVKNMRGTWLTKPNNHKADEFALFCCYVAIQNLPARTKRKVQSTPIDLIM